ncbi:SDR family NAD(P)-dependent oxidoreductase [Streptomyces sp. NPDC015032]|uniref:SDR family NAD(P)-dependent oxidoreductase n=1 Tax=Streptomyces sp. NPDC015032 TaxID=3364937 RepID=UPI0036F76BA9
MTRTAVVTGASSGIGAATRAVMTETGWTVVGLDLTPSDDGSVLQCDVANPQSVADAIERVRTQFGPIEAVVSAAGHYEIVRLEDITPESWSRMLRVHLGGLANVSRAVLPDMIERRSGTIVAVSSELGITGGDSEAHYAAAKGAMIGFVRSLAAEVATHGIRVNAVAPGPTDTPLLPAAQRTPEYVAALPAGALATTDEIAQVIQFLVDEGGFCVGEVISPNMGAVI